MYIIINVVHMELATRFDVPDRETQHDYSG